MNTIPDVTFRPIERWLTFTLMRSATFRGLDSVVALMIVREVLE